MSIERESPEINYIFPREPNIDVVAEEIESARQKNLEIPEDPEKTKEILEREKVWADKLTEIHQKHNLEVYPPIFVNIDSDTEKTEKEKFFSSLKEDSDFSPTFVYKESQFYDFETPEEKLLALKTELVGQEKDPIVQALYRQRINVSLAVLRLGRSIAEGDDRNTFRYAKFLYGRISPEIKDYAEKRYQELLETAGKKEETSEVDKKLDRKDFNATKIKDFFDLALKEYGLDASWKVGISEQIKAVTVKQQLKEILIPINRTMSVVELLSLIGHEIEGHVLRAENGRLAPLSILKGEVGIARYGHIEEALAVMREKWVQEKIFNRKTRKALPWYALAISRASKGGNFRDVFIDISQKRKELLIKEGLTEDEAGRKAKEAAWEACRRIFRGFSNTGTARGCYMPMDLSYISGEMELEKLQATGYDSLLEMGKVDVKSLPDIIRLGIDPKIIKFPFKNVAEKLWRERLKKDYI